MCYSCWEGYGSPTSDNPQIRECAKLIDDLYNYPEGGVGGNLHIITDDWNIDDEHIQFCQDQVDKNDYDIPYGQLATEKRILELMTPMLIDERASVLGRKWNFIKEAVQNA